MHPANLRRLRIQGDQGPIGPWKPPYPLLTDGCAGIVVAGLSMVQQVSHLRRRRNAAEDNEREAQQDTQ